MTARKAKASKSAAPAHLPADVARVWVEVVARFGDESIAGPALEAYCGQVARLREAQARLAEEGLIVTDPKGNPIPHPAIQVERVAQDEIRKWRHRFEP